MSGINSTFSSTSRITGLYSQLDTDKIVKDLLNIQQTKVSSRGQEKTKQEWLGDAYGDVRSLLTDFRNNFLSALGADSMVISSTYQNLKTEVTGVSSSAVSITAKSSAFTGSYAVDYIEQLAKNASVTSSSGVSANGKSISENNTTRLEDLKFANALQFDQNGKISFGINGETFTFDKSTTLQSMINTVNANEKAGVTMKYSRLTDRFTIEADNGGSESRVSITNYAGNAFGAKGAFGIGTGSTDDAEKSAFVSGRPAIAEGQSISEEDSLSNIASKLKTPLEFDADGNISFSINDKVFSFSSDISLKDMMRTVNEDKDANVIISFDGGTKAFALQAKDGGANSKVDIKNISGNAFGQDSAFGLDASVTTGSRYGEKGQDAILSVDGTRITRNSNNFTVDGLEFNLKGITAAKDINGQPGEPAIRFQVTRDVSTTVEKVKKFVTAFNELTDKLNGMLSEKDQSKKYAPLTPEQEDELSESQIEAWNKKAKSGLLRNNQDLRGFLNGLKNTFFSSLGGTGKAATALGLSTGNRYTSDNGKIILDEAALTRALEENPDAVTTMFTGTEAGSEGLMRRVTNSINNYVKKLDNSVQASDKKIRGLDDKIKGMEDDLEKMAERYYLKFSAMEQAMGKLNSQMGFLSTLMSS